MTIVEIIARDKKYYDCLSDEGREELISKYLAALARACKFMSLCNPDGRRMNAVNEIHRILTEGEE